jgi:hypothetical protein
MDLKELTTLAEDVQILRGLSEKLLDELAGMEAVIDSAVLEIRMEG